MTRDDSNYRPLLACRFPDCYCGGPDECGTERMHAPIDDGRRYAASPLYTCNLSWRRALTLLVILAGIVGAVLVAIDMAIKSH